jgi:hypothetical protein
MSATKSTKTAKPKAAKARATKPAKTAKPKADGKLSALDAAARVLASAGELMNCKELIEAMAAKELWSSPNGATRQTALCIRPCFVRSMRRRERHGL